MYIATGMSFGVFLMTSFMKTVPLELEEAAKIDGCSIYRTYFSIVMPLLKPAMATLVIMQAFQTWNDYLMASLYVSKKDLKTLTVAMQALFSQQTSDYSTALAAIVLSVLPVAILFISLQKYFIKGMTVGAVKG
jgi:raffinose/stachyose/melibiose transport system permease protein